MSDHYDVIVIGSGPGGAALAQRLAPTGKRILILERGEYLERSERNWSAQTVFVDGEYQAHEISTNSRGETFSPALHYFVGGNSKVYGAAKELLRAPWGFCYQCKTPEHANALQRELVAAGAVCTVEYVDAYGRPVSEERASEAA